MAVKRYSMLANFTMGALECKVDECGNWVRYKDFKKVVDYIKMISKSGPNEEFKKIVNGLIKDN